MISTTPFSHALSGRCFVSSPPRLGISLVVALFIREYNKVHRGKGCTRKWRSKRWKLSRLDWSPVVAPGAD